ncbi:MAG TPA: hypothetical protein VHG92_15680, partial [Afifellaceae bacterium]|nr:hypothetical protein [Afifellaceae bacterium]
LVTWIFAFAAAVLIAGCEAERADPTAGEGPGTEEAGRRSADETETPASTERQRELERRAYETQRGP